MSLPILIRDALPDDIPTCLALDLSYETERVWQMTFQPETGNRGILFRTERLPRPMTVPYLADERRLRLCISKKHCFVVALTKSDNRLVGYLTMRAMPTHKIALIQDIAVGEIYRRQGVGLRLLNVARRWAMEHELIQLQVETQTKNYPAIQFLQKNGLNFCGFNDQYFLNGDIAVFFGQALK